MNDELKQLREDIARLRERVAVIERLRVAVLESMPLPGYVAPTNPLVPPYVVTCVVPSYVVT